MYAGAIAGLCEIHLHAGRLGEAEAECRESLAIRERWLVPNHFMIARSVENLADARVAQGRMDEALGLLLLDEAEWVLAEADAQADLDAWADDFEAATPLMRARYFGLPVSILIAAPLVGMAVTSMVLHI